MRDPFMRDLVMQDRGGGSQGLPDEGAAPGVDVRGRVEWRGGLVLGRRPGM